MEYKGFTYTPTPKTAWDNLSMLEKSEMMKVAVRNGITDLKTIREKYNEFAEGGNIYSGDEEETQQMEISKSPHVDLAVNNPWLYQKLHPAQRKAEKYEPTTFAGRITQLAGASELGQKFADYTSSVIQQVPVVGLVPSGLDLGYDTNRLYHNPSLTTTKDVTLDAASLVPALRKTMKGWWMKGNSGSFITEAGQIINNPRIASTLEVTLQPFRTAINTGVYGARAADFLDDSKAYLKEMYNSSKIGKHFPIKALGGPLVEAAMNEYKKGGGIHIAPSKKGTFTAAASRHNMGVQEFASKVLANKDNYSPAMVKKANFAMNASHWKHGEGGPLQGPIVNMANMYGGGGFLEWLKSIYHGAMQTIGLEDTPEELSLKRGNERYKQYGYIGGEPRETRQKYFTVDKEFTDSVNSISKRYGLNPSVVASRIAEEGPIDNAIDIYNNKEKKGTTGLILSDDRNKGTFGPLWGLDDFYTRANDNKVKVTTSAPHSYKKQMFINEHGRLTESIVSPQWWFGIEATAAEMKARRDKLKKNNPWMNNQQLDAATAMSFNYGEWGVQKHINQKKFIPKRFNPYIKTK